MYSRVSQGCVIPIVTQWGQTFVKIHFVRTLDDILICIIEALNFAAFSDSLGQLFYKLMRECMCFEN